MVEKHADWDKIAEEANKSKDGATEVDHVQALKVIQESLKDSKNESDKLDAESKDKLLKEGGVHTNNQTTVKQYFNYYAKLVNQQNMMQDNIRT